MKCKEYCVRVPELLSFCYFREHTMLGRQLHLAKTSSMAKHFLRKGTPLQLLLSLFVSYVLFSGSFLSLLPALTAASFTK